MSGDLPQITQQSPSSNQTRVTRMASPTLLLSAPLLRIIALQMCWAHMPSVCKQYACAECSKKIESLGSESFRYSHGAHS